MTPWDPPLDFGMGKNLPTVQYSDTFLLSDMSDVPEEALKKIGALIANNILKYAESLYQSPLERKRTIA